MSGFYPNNFTEAGQGPKGKFWILDAADARKLHFRVKFLTSLILSSLTKKHNEEY